MQAVEQLWPSVAAYHADRTCISQTALKILYCNSALYHGIYVTEKIALAKPTAAMELGTLTHLLTLQPELAAETVCCTPELGPRGGQWDRKSKYHETFIAENPGREVYAAAEYRTACAMRNSLLAHPVVSGALKANFVEHIIRWADPLTDIDCRAMLDIVVDSEPWILDLKTALDPSPRGFATACARNLYALQNWFYVEGFMRVYGRVPRFFFVAVGNKPPHSVGVYELDSEAIKLGASIGRQCLDELLRRRTQDDWAPDWTQRRSDPLAVAEVGSTVRSMESFTGRISYGDR